VVPDVDELEDGDPRQMVVENALRKIRAVEGDLVLGVDTTVVLDGRSYGKPQNEEEAEETLQLLSGRTHEVWSGIALNERTAAACTRVTFRPLTRSLLRWYLATDEWKDRAGAYAIQGKGAALVEGIEGDFWNVVGLPVPALLNLAPDLLA
jgi:septum formation protein